MEMMYTTWNPAKAGFAGSGGEESAVYIANDADVVDMHAAVYWISFLCTWPTTSSSPPSWVSRLRRTFQRRLVPSINDGHTSHLNYAKCEIASVLGSYSDVVSHSGLGVLLTW